MIPSFDCLLGPIPVSSFGEYQDFVDNRETYSVRQSVGVISALKLN